MSTLKSIFECKICHSPLSECVLLPCGESVCQNHTINTEEICCPSCDKKHIIPKNGFPLNKVVNLLFETNIHKLDMGEKFQRAAESCSKLGNSIQIYNNLIENPSKFVRRFFEEIIDKLACKCQEFKLENETRSQNLIFELKFSKKNCLAEIRKSIQSYLELAHAALNSIENKNELCSNLESKIYSAKYVIDSLIDQAYSKLLDEYKFLFDRALSFADTFRADEKYAKEIDKTISEHQKFVNDLKILKKNDQIYSLLKQNIDNNREIANVNIRRLKDGLLMNKGYDLESKLFYFPIINNNNLTTWKDHQCFELDLKGLDKYAKNYIIGDQLLINGIAFYIGLKLEEDSLGQIYCLGGLLCSNSFNFCGINVEYSMQLSPIMDKPLIKKTCIKCFSPGFCKLTTLNRYFNYNQKDFKLYVHVRILNLRNRNLSKVNLRMPKKKQKKYRKAKSFGQNLIKVTGPDFDLDYQPE